MSEEARPTAVLENVWRERDAWARAAREGKARQGKARTAALSLSVGGAMLAALAAVWEGAGTTLGIASAVAIALAGYFGRELLTPERETRWARARLLAEALKRECWRYRMAVPPFDGPDAHDVLRARVEQMIRNRGLERVPLSAEQVVTPPAATSVGEYLEQRVLEQARYYEKSSGSQRTRRDRLNRVAFALGAVAVTLGVVGSTFTAALAFVPVLTTATAALVAWIQGNRVGATIPLYQETAGQLRLQEARWRDAERQRASLPEAERRAEEARLVEACEEIMARENGAWRAEWLSEEKAQQLAAAIGRVAASAPGTTGGSER